MPILKNIYFKSLIIWLVPFLVSFGFYNQAGKLVGNFWVFKLTMLVILCLTTFFAFKNFFKNHQNWLEISGKIIAVNVFLDLVVLHLILKMPLQTWLAQILPMYLIIIPSVCYLLQNSSQTLQKNS
jgi:hypothetical protein